MLTDLWVSQRTDFLLHAQLSFFCIIARNYLEICRHHNNFSPFAQYIQNNGTYIPGHILSEVEIIE